MDFKKEESLLANLKMAPRDPILGMTEAFVADSNPNKVNLGVGVYYDDRGKVPLLECVRLTDQALTESNLARPYLAMDGIPEYVRAVQALLFGALRPRCGDLSFRSQLRQSPAAVRAGGVQDRNVSLLRSAHPWNQVRGNDVLSRDGSERLDRPFSCVLPQPHWGRHTRRAVGRSHQARFGAPPGTVPRFRVPGLRGGDRRGRGGGPAVWRGDAPPVRGQLLLEVLLPVRRARRGLERRCRGQRRGGKGAEPAEAHDPHELFEPAVTRREDRHVDTGIRRHARPVEKRGRRHARPRPRDAAGARRPPQAEDSRGGFQLHPEAERNLLLFGSVAGPDDRPARTLLRLRAGVGPHLRRGIELAQPRLRRRFDREHRAHERSCARADAR